MRPNPLTGFKCGAMEVEVIGIGYTLQKVHSNFHVGNGMENGLAVAQEKYKKVTTVTLSYSRSIDF